MASTTESPVARRRTWRWCVGVTIVTLLCASMVVGAWATYESVEAERNLQATQFAVRLVEQFVQEKDRWPNSWGELEEVYFRNPPQTYHPGWPFSRLQERVIIDFGADTGAIIDQDVMEFQAIQPNGPYYEYRKYGIVESLQETLREAVSANNARSAEFGIHAGSPRPVNND